MAVPFVLMAAGTALQVFGQYKANMDQAAAEIQNAKFYEWQANFAKEAQFRQAELASAQYEFRKGAQLSAYGKGGVDISGSAAGVIAETAAAKISELIAIKRKGDLEFNLASARARQSRGRAEQLQSLEYNLLQGGTTVLSSAAMATDNNPNSKFGQWMTSTFGE